MKTYEKLIRLETFEERYEYLRLDGRVAATTFGFDRYLNQDLYTSKEWLLVRRNVLLRDKGCDLAIPDREIFARAVVHHINPLSIKDLEAGSSKIFDLNNLVCTSFDTHNAIHYGNESLLRDLPTERKKGDTCPWKQY